MTIKTPAKIGTICPTCGKLSDFQGNEITTIESGISLWKRKGYIVKRCRECQK